jgi:hypothetical protein
MGGGQRFLRIVLPGFGADVCDLASLADDGAAGERVLAAHRPKKIDRKINDLGHDGHLGLEKQVHDYRVLKQSTDDAAVNQAQGVVADIGFAKA